MTKSMLGLLLTFGSLTAQPLQVMGDDPEEGTTAA